MSAINYQAIDIILKIKFSHLLLYLSVTRNASSLWLLKRVLLSQNFLSNGNNLLSFTIKPLCSAPFMLMKWLRVELLGQIRIELLSKEAHRSDSGDSLLYPTRGEQVTGPGAKNRRMME